MTNKLSGEDFAVVSLSEVAFLQEGPGLRNRQWTSSGMKVINIKNILANGCINTSNTFRYISHEEFASRYARFAIEAGDIVIASSGNTYGKVGRISAEHLPLMMNTSVIRLHSGDRRRLDDEYLYAFIRTPKFSQQVDRAVVGAAQPNFGPSHLKRMHILLPSLATQKKIAAVIKGYDSLIDNNRQQIKVLAEMAANLYDEWFVRWRFPGHEQQSFYNSALGRIPGKWRVQAVRDTFDTFSGGTPSKSKPEYWQGGDILWYVPSNLTASRTMYLEDSTRKITELGMRKSSARLFPAGSVMMTSRATLGFIAINSHAACANQGFIICLPNQQFPRQLLYHWLKKNVQNFANLATGVTFKEISKGTFISEKLVVPPLEIATEFEQRTAPLATQILHLERQITALSESRDMLLPRLAAGVLDISQLDITPHP